MTVNGLTSWTGGTVAGTLNAAGGGSITGGAQKLLSGTLENGGTLAFAPTGTFYVYFDLSASAIQNDAGATFDFQADAAITNYGSAGSAFANAGTLKKSAGAGVGTVGIPLNSTGTVEADSGTLRLDGGLSNYSSGTSTLTGGTYVVSATLAFPGAAINTNASTIVLKGPGSKILDSNSSGGALDHFATNSATGSFTIQDGRNLTTYAAFSNAGGVTIGASSTFTATGTYSQTSGSTNLVGGTLADPAGFSLSGGVLSGNGIVSGDVNNSGGAVVPGGVGAAGQIAVGGSYTQGAGGSLNLELGGTTVATTYDQLAVTGVATLAGTLNVALINGFAPGQANTFQVLTFASRSGDFTTRNLPPTITTTYRTNDLILGVIVDVTTGVKVKRGGFLYNRVTHRFVQPVTITNNTGAALSGPVSLVLDNLTGVTLANPTGTTTMQSGPAGRPYVNFIAAGGTLASGASITMYLEFSNITGPSIGYTTRVLAGSGAR